MEKTYALQMEKSAGDRAVDGLLAGIGFTMALFIANLNFHLAGYRLVSIEQAGFDRSVVFTFKHKDTYGETVLKLLRNQMEVVLLSLDRPQVLLDALRKVAAPAPRQ